MRSASRRGAPGRSSTRGWKAFSRGDACRPSTKSIIGAPCALGAKVGFACVCFRTATRWPRSLRCCPPGDCASRGSLDVRLLPADA
jgi:hypothetical protein